MKEVAAEAVQMLQNIPDPYFQERAVDVQDVLEQLLTLDIGGDKKAPALELPKQQNPFLGVRKIVDLKEV